MKKRITAILSTILMTAMVFSPSVKGLENQTDTRIKPGIHYKTHIQDYGWEADWRSDGGLSGTVGESKRLEALMVKLTGDLPKGTDVKTYVHVQNIGDMGPFDMESEAGTSGRSYRLESVRLEMKNLPGYGLLYNVQVEEKGWLRDENDPETWFKNGEIAGTSGESLRLEGFKLKVVEVNEDYQAYLSTLAAAKEADYTSESWVDYKKVVDANQVTKDNPRDEIKKATANIVEAQKKLVSAKNMAEYNRVLAAVKEADYVPNTWQAYKNVVTNNMVTLKNTQTQIDKASKTIFEAQKKLEKKVNLTGYKAALEAVRPDDYTGKSWAVYEDAVAANGVSEDNSQTEVDKATKKIEAAQKKLVRIFDFTNYNELLNRVKEEDYVAITWEVYEDVLAANKVDENNTQSDIEKAISKIEKAQTKLVKKADLSYYNALLAAVDKDDYTTDSWKTYQQVVRSVTVNEMSKAEVIDKAVMKIMEAQLDLVPAGDLIYYMAAINKKSRTDYTTASWAIYQKAVEANAVIPSDGQEAIDEATEKIEAAQKKLVGVGDMTEYNKVLNNVNKDLYTSDSWEKYQKVLESNYTSGGWEQKAIDAAIIKIEAAQQKLVKKGDLSEYEKVKKYNFYREVEMDQKDYTTASWEKYTKVLDSNFMDYDKSQVQMDQAVTKIKNAQVKLAVAGILTEYNKVLLYNLDRDPTGGIPMKETEYTSASWGNYWKILKANEMDRDKSQVQIDGAVVKIERAQANLALKGELSEYLSIRNKVKESDYTVKSWTAYEKALSSKGYLVTSDNSQAEIDRAKELVEEAQWRILKIKGDTTDYNILISKYTDQDLFKTKPWDTYQAILNKYLMTSENTDQQIADAMVYIVRAQANLILPKNLASILTEYDEVQAEVDGKDSYTPTSWKDYQSAIKPYLGYTKDNDQLEINEGAKKIKEAQSLLVRSNGAELTAFEDALEMYMRYEKDEEEEGDLKNKVTPETWTAYETQVKTYASFYPDYTWQETAVVNKDSRPEVIKEATAAIEKTIRKLRPNRAVLDLNYEDYETTVEGAVPWRDDLEIWSESVAQVKATYTLSSYNDYARTCKGYEILNYIEISPGKVMDQNIIDYVTSGINNAQGLLHKRASKDERDAFTIEFQEFTNLRADKETYTEASWKNYESVYTKSGLNLNNPEEIRQTDCLKATKDLKDAREGLVLRS